MTDIDTAARRLVHARQARCLQEAPPLTDADMAYAVQHQVGRVLGWFGGAAPHHWKSGAASRAATASHAPLPPAGVWDSPADARDWPFTWRGIEAEVALRLREPVDAARAAALEPVRARDLVDAMCVSIEVVDSRWTDGLRAPALAQLADGLSHGALVLGDWVAFDPDRDWSMQSGTVHIGAQPVHRFRGSHPLADPGFVLVAWLRHATRCEAVMPAGTVVTTGSWCGLQHAEPGDDVRVVFDGVGEARIRL